MRRLHEMKKIKLFGGEIAFQAMYSDDKNVPPQPIEGMFITKRGRLYDSNGRKININEKGKNGYPRAYWNVNNDIKAFLCHRICAFTFFDYNNEEGIDVHHIGRKMDFSYDNIIVLDRDSHELIHMMGEAMDNNSKQMKKMAKRMKMIEADANAKRKDAIYSANKAIATRMESIINLGLKVSSPFLLSGFSDVIENCAVMDILASKFVYVKSEKGLEVIKNI
ncbi:MAG: hypothetical protein ACRDD8_16385 [Bacteroidales bacterium]